MIESRNVRLKRRSATYGYDQDGDRCWSSATSTSGSCTSPPSGADTYTWNAYHQLTASNYNATAATYAYNGDGLRTTDTIGSTTQNFIWDTVTDPSQPLTLEDSTNAYIYGPTTTPIEQVALSTETPQYLASDPGGVRYLFGSASTLNETLGYGTFGAPTTTGSSTTPFGFQGAYTDSDGLVYLINRYYDPATAQFLSVDPDVAETGEPYAFTGDDPLNSIDPLGLQQGWWYKSRRASRRYFAGSHFLPTEGQRHYVSPNRNGTPKLERGNPVDNAGNVWEWQSSTRTHAGPHFDVEHPLPLEHTNVAANGDVLHGGDNFPTNVGTGPKYVPTASNPASVYSDGSPTPYALNGNVLTPTGGGGGGSCSSSGPTTIAWSPSCGGTPVPTPIPTPGGGASVL